MSGAKIDLLNAAKLNNGAIEEKQDTARVLLRQFSDPLLSNQRTVTRVLDFEDFCRVIAFHPLVQVTSSLASCHSFQSSPHWLQIFFGLEDVARPSALYLTTQFRKFSQD